MMNYKKLALTVAAGAMATTMMAQSAPQLKCQQHRRSNQGYDLGRESPDLSGRW